MRASSLAVESLESRTLLSSLPLFHMMPRGWRAHKSSTTVQHTVSGGSVTPATSLPAPTGVTVSGATTSSIRVSWYAVPGADHYNVLQRKVLHSPKGSGATIYYVGVASTTGTSVVLNLTSGTFEVVAVDASGVASPPSALASGSALSAPSLYNFLWGGAVMSSAYVEVGQSLSVTLLGYGNEPPTYAMTSGPSTMSVNPTTGVVTYTPDASEAGYNSATFVATNSVGSSMATFQFHVLSAPAVVVTGGLFTFDGNTHSASAVAYATDGITPLAGTFSFLYAPASYPTALSTAPYAESGSYIVQATFTSSDPNYGGATGTSTITINPATPTMALPDTEVTYNGGLQTIPTVALSVDGLTPVNGTYTSTYNGSATPPINPGTYTVVTTFTSNNQDYTDITKTATLTIDPAAGPILPTIIFNPGPFTYDGTPQGATAAAVAGDGITPISGIITYLYDGSSTPPTNAGTYNVEADFTSSDSNFTHASASTTFTIDPATPALVVTGGIFTYDGQPHGASVSVLGIDGVTPVSGTTTFDYGGTSDPPVDAGYYYAIASFTSSDPNYADTVNYDSIEIDPATPAFSNLSAKAAASDGSITQVSGHIGAGAVAPAGDVVSIRFAGVTQAAAIDANGNFSSLFATPNLSSGESYTIRYSFAGDWDFNPASATSSYRPAGAAPAIRLQPMSQVVSAGATVTFSASATGSPTPRIQWQVSTDGGKTFTSITGATSTSYSFTAGSTQNGYHYRAVFSNNLGTVTTLDATLTVMALV
ncbi:MAG TPA: MBG domain-containing protein [Phycisphaerae bacterium]|nr:MBG domain-containing protein [Phycisphaerae bacterium]